MQESEQWIRQQVGVGWVVALLVLSLMLGAMVLQALFSDAELTAVRIDPGTFGLAVSKYAFGIYLVMIIAVYTFEVRRRWIRWIFVGIAAAMLLLFVLHHLSHMVAGQRPDFLSHMMDLQHHVAMSWVVYNSVRWARVLPAGS